MCFAQVIKSGFLRTKRILCFHFFFRFKSLPLGDDTFCKRFRTTHEDYQLDRRFVNILDIAVLDYMMLSYESRDNYIINKKNERVNVFIDRGKS